MPLRSDTPSGTDSTKVDFMSLVRPPIPAPLDPNSYAAIRLADAPASHVHATSLRKFIGSVPEPWSVSDKDRRRKVTDIERGYVRSNTVAGQMLTAGALPAESTSAAAAEIVSPSFPQPADVDEDPESSDNQDRPPSRTGETASASTKPTSQSCSGPAPDPGNTTSARVGISFGARDSGQFVDSGFAGTPNRDSGAPTMISNTSEPNALTSPTFVSGIANSEASLIRHPAGDNDSGSLDQNPGPVGTSEPSPTESNELTGARAEPESSAAVVEQQHQTAAVEGGTPAGPGMIEKIGKMLVRIHSSSLPDLPDDFSEAVSYRVPFEVDVQWREYMVVCRNRPSPSGSTSAADGGVGGQVLQFYLTRAIPELDTSSSSQSDESKSWTRWFSGRKNRNGPKFEINLDPGRVRIRLFSSLDKSICVWFPQSRKTTIYLLKPMSMFEGVEWSALLGRTLGWAEPGTVRVDVPDFQTTIEISDPFSPFPPDTETVETGARGDECQRTTVVDDTPTADKLAGLCLDTLAKAWGVDWRAVLTEMVRHNGRIGFAWKHYDRLEWVYGEQVYQLRETITLNRTHELQFRQMIHYPTQADPSDFAGEGEGLDHDDDGDGGDDVTTTAAGDTPSLGRTCADPNELVEEPVPVEGYLTRMTTERGNRTRLWRAFRRRIYCATYDQYLFFLSPMAALPPELPNSDPPADQASHLVDPFPIVDGQVGWLTGSPDPESVRERSDSAVYEWARNGHNIHQAESVVDLRTVVSVRMVKPGRSSEPVSCHTRTNTDTTVDNRANSMTTTTTEANVIHEGREFEIVLNSGLAIRLAGKTPSSTREWVDSLSRLSRYWKLRTRQDSAYLAAVRTENMALLGGVSAAAEAAAAAEASAIDTARVTTSPVIWNACDTLGCRPIHYSGILFAGPAQSPSNAPTEQFHAILAYGRLLLFATHVRYRSGIRKKSVHMPRSRTIDLAGAYLLSGRMAGPKELSSSRGVRSENSALAAGYRIQADSAALSNRMAPALPRVWRADGIAVTDDDASLQFGIWRNTARKGIFRARVPVGHGAAGDNDDDHRRRRRRSGDGAGVGTRTASGVASRTINEPAPSRASTLRWRLVSRLGVKGQADVLMARSRVERDKWVLAIDAEMQRIRAARRAGGGDVEETVRLVE